VKKGRRSGVAVGLDANRLDRGLHIVLTATLEPPGRGAGGAYIGYPGPTTGSARWSARSGSAASPAPARRGRQGSMRRFPSRLSGGANNQCRPSVAFDGGNFVVAWQDLRDGKAYRIYGARVSAEGKVLDQEGVLLSGAKEFHQTVAVASAGDGRTLVAWGSTNRGAGGIPEGIFVREGKATGLAIPPCSSRDVPKGLAKSVYAMKGLYPALAAGKDSFLLAWRNYLPAGRGGNGTRACCQVVSADGKRGELLTFTGKAQVAIDPQVVWDGVAYVAAWGDICETRKKGQNAQPGVFVNRLGKDGKPLCPAERASGSWESPAQRPALASDGAGTTLVTYEKHPATADVPIKIAFRLLRAK